ncbi:spermine/spermidine synthase domain-containing protein [Mangrovibacterium lignilyticum]|uniref:spermine/spermidine synthase domain-containing protein n=1 Tax=Mangrovibacterium lignilyticum TaxID=2668052 RepID=UPI0013D37C31|nr:hypothetical protein [Mangrovibacterium lignilyticum]
MNTAYPLFPVSVTILLAYFVSSLFSRWGIFTNKSHRKFWNVLLLITFLVSGLLGLLSVAKVNYKLEIPYYDLLMKWHVSLGIGMVIIAFFHLSWHWKYYFSLQKGKTKIGSDPQVSELESESLSKVGILLFLLGLLAVINQVVFIREFMSVMAGNELVLGIVMAVWLVLTGWGSYIGKKGIPAGFTMWRATSMLLALSLLPLVSVAMLYWLKSQLFPPGTITGIGSVVWGAFFLLYPVCFLSGYLFTLFSTLLSNPGQKNRIGKAYAFESLGSLVGGLFFSFILGRFFNTCQIFGITGALVLGIGAWLDTDKARRVACFSGVLLLPLVVFLLKPDTRIKKWLYPSQEIIGNVSTRYGNLIVTRQADQLNFYENHSLQLFSGNFMLSEEAVHFAMVQRENPRQILLLSGGISGMIGELNKYELGKITYLESNPEVYRYWKNKAGKRQDFEKVEFIRADIRTFLSGTSDVYDVILMNLPPPSTLGINRFYTDEFFRILKQHCLPQTVVCVSLPSTMNYAGGNALQEDASLWKTMGEYFPNRLVLIGEKNYFLASGEELSANIAERVSRRGIENKYVNRYYIDDLLLQRRSQQLESDIRKVAPYVKINRDFYPYMFIKHTLYWLSHFETSYTLLVVIPALVFFVIFFKLDTVSLGLYTAGFSAATLELCLMLAYQVFYGSLYLATALFFAVFFGGLALGSSVKSNLLKYSGMKSYALLQFLLAVLAMLVPLFLELIGLGRGWRIFSQFIFFCFVFLLAFGIGYEFYLASGLRSVGLSETSGINYSTDLVGSAFGAFLTSIILLPRFGVVVTCLIVALLNVFSGGAALNAARN